MQKLPFKITVLLFLCYFLIGALVPFVNHKPISTPLEEPTIFQDERVMLIEENQNAHIWRIRLIESAKSEVILSTFDFKVDRTGLDTISALYAAAERGVKVRVLIDGFNGILHFYLYPEAKTLAAHENIELKLYNPIHLLLPWTINPRLHDKFLLADEKTYILGGRNIHNRFLGKETKRSSDDRDLLVWKEADEGGSAREIKAYFDTLWNLPSSKLFKGRAHHNSLLSRYSGLKDKMPDAFIEIDWRDATIETDGISLISGAIEAENKPPVTWKKLCSVMEKGNEIILQTPYVICSKEMYEDLYSLNREKDVTIVTNSIENGANPWGCADFLNQKDNILKTGSTIKTIDSGHSVHAKTILVDDDISIVGSFNLDCRSAYLDTETMLVVYSEELNKKLKESIAAKPSVSYFPDGSVYISEGLRKKKLPLIKRILYTTLRVITPPFRFLL